MKNVTLVMLLGVSFQVPLHASPFYVSQAEPEQTRRLAQASQATCPTTLAHLEATLPRYNHAQLMQVRQAVVSENILNVLQKIRAAGLTPSAGAAQLLQNSREAEAQQQRSEQCMRQVSTTPDEDVAALKNGTYQFGMQTIKDSCAGSIVNMYYGMVGMKETAIAVACHANAR